MAAESGGNVGPKLLQLSIEGLTRRSRSGTEIEEDERRIFELRRARRRISAGNRRNSSVIYYLAIRTLISGGLQRDLQDPSCPEDVV